MINMFPDSADISRQALALFHQDGELRGEIYHKQKPMLNIYEEHYFCDTPVKICQC